MSAMEAGFQPLVQSWVAEETQQQQQQQQHDADGGGARDSFTRVLIGQIKPEVLRQISSDEAGQQICRWLDSLYMHGKYSKKEMDFRSICSELCRGNHRHRLFSWYIIIKARRLIPFCPWHAGI